MPSLTAHPSLSASCQQVVHEDLSDLANSKVIIRSCMAHPDLSPTVTNHKCNHVVLTPSGLYADMAVEVAHYIWKHHRGRDAELPGINVCDLEVHKPLIVKDPAKMDQLWLEMEVTASISEYARQDITNAVLKCVFHSISPDGARLQENGHCNVRFEWYYGWLSEWSNSVTGIKNCIDSLYARASSDVIGQVSLVQRKTAYKLFESFVQYSGKYQNMAEVIFDSDTLEATSLLDFQPDPTGDLCGPYYLDGSCHLSGFVCNAVEKDKDKNAYISHGVTAMRLSPMFRPDEKNSEIRNYVRMQPLPTDKTVLQGDVYVLQDGQIVGMWEGVRFKRIPRKVLNVFLPPPPKPA
ncbi:Hypothetical predicted protein [Lecanosticta acicola]|uniref:PKS/mFAS DH domain-containing protein n=1 Tax=Lecanosticta acicola TaxID=111012 RepID=A0AAI9EBL0_9PEZI|nr:Hypothetical predicted protein [Lecanosticta acicola]